MSKAKPISIILHGPKTEEGIRTLRCQTAEIQAEYVLDAIRKLSVSPEQKLELLNAVIAAAKSKANFDSSDCASE